MVFGHAGSHCVGKPSGVIGDNRVVERHGWRDPIRYSGAGGHGNGAAGDQSGTANRVVDQIERAALDQQGVPAAIICPIVRKEVIDKAIRRGYGHVSVQVIDRAAPRLGAVV